MAVIPLQNSLPLAYQPFKIAANPYYDGSVDNGKPIGDDESDGIRVKLRVDISDTLQFNFAGFTYNGSGPGALLTPNTEPSKTYSALLPSEEGYRADLDAPVDQVLENEVYYASLEWTVTPFDIKLLASKQHIDISYATDFDGTALPVISFIANNQLADVDTAELQILSNENSLGSGWLSWIVGGYYFESVQGYDPVILQAADLDLGAGTLAGIMLPSVFLTPLVSAIGLDNLVPTGNIALRSLIGTESIAGFFQATAELSDWFSLTLGARYQDEYRQVIKSDPNYKP